MTLTGFARRLDRRRLIIAAAAVFLLLFTQNEITMTNPASRFLTMSALAEDRSLAITGRHQLTDDKFRHNGEYYSSKPPLLSAAGAAIYFILLKSGLSLPTEPYYYAPNAAVFLITLSLAGLAYLLLLNYFFRFCLLAGLAPNAAALLTAGLGAGTLYLPYAITLNNHSIAGACLFIAFYLLFKARLENRSSEKLLAAAGALSALAAVIEIQTGALFLVLFGIYAWLSFPRRHVLFFIAGALPPLAGHLFLNYQVTGSLLPIQLLAGDEISLPGIIQHKENVPVYAFNILFGTHGLLSYSPLLAFGFYGIFKAVKAKDALLRREAVLVLVGFLLLLAFYLAKIRFYTGSAFGFRWFIAITPLLYAFAVLSFPLSARAKNWFSLALLASVLVAVIGLYNPWPNVRYRFDLGEGRAKVVNFPLLANWSEINRRLLPYE